MNPVISVIIPVYREFEHLGDCLSHLAGQRDIETAEIIVVDGDGGSSLDTIRTEEYPFRLIPLVSPMGRGAQQNHGARAARAYNLLFLHADTRLPVRAFRKIGRTLEKTEAGAFDLSIETGHLFIQMVALMTTIRSRLSRIPYGDQGIFIRRDTFLRIGGFEEIPIMEDVALMLRLKRQGIRIRLLGSPVKTSDRRWKQEGALYATLRNWCIFRAYRFGASPWRLASHYPQNRTEE